MDITATDSAVETVCQALLAYSGQFGDALQRVADPAAFLLVSFHRVSPVSAALTGKIITWGRKPWLLLRLQSVLRSV